MLLLNEITSNRYSYNSRLVVILPNCKSAPDHTEAGLVWARGGGTTLWYADAEHSGTHRLGSAGFDTKARFLARLAKNELGLLHFTRTDPSPKLSWLGAQLENIKSEIWNKK